MDELNYGIRVDNSSVGRAFDDLDKRVDNTNKKTSSLGSNVSAAFKATTVAATALTGALTATVGAAFAFWKLNADLIDQQTKLATSMGLTYAQFERLDYAAGMAGASQQSLTAGLKKLSLGLNDAIKGVGPASDALKTLGLDANTLANMPLDQAMGEVAEAMGGVGNASDRMRIAINLFGRDGMSLMPLLTENVKQLSQEADDMGLTLSQMDVTGVVNAGDAFARVGKSISAVGSRFTADLSPAIEAISDSIFGVTNGMGRFGGAGAVAADLVTNSIGLLINIWDVLHGTVMVLTSAVMDFGAYGVDVFNLLLQTTNAFYKPFKMMINGWIEIHNLIYKDEQWSLLGDLDKAVIASKEFAANLHGAAADLTNKGLSTIAGGLTGKGDDAFMARVDANRQKAADAAAAQELSNGVAQGVSTAGVADPKDKEEKAAKMKTADEWDAEMEDSLAAAAKEAQADNERYARKYEQAQQHLDKINELGMSELELIALQHEQKMAQLGEFRQDELISEEEHTAALAKLDAEYQQKKIQTLLAGNASLQQVSKAFEQSQLQGAISFFAQGLSGLAGHSRKIFEVSKAAKISQAAITLPETVMNAYNAGMMAGGPAGPVVGAAYAAVALGTQLTQIKAISSSTFGGGMSGGGGGAAPAPTVASATGGDQGNTSSGPSSIIELGLAPDDSLFSGATVNGLMERMAQVVNDGGGRALLRVVNPI